MRPSGAVGLVREVMEMTSLRLNHVVAHSGVRWWASALPGGSLELENELGLAASAAAEMHHDPADFMERVSQLPALHYTAAQLLLPHLRNTAGSSYTFVTGGASEQQSVEAQVNTHGVWGLAAALRAQYKASPAR